MEQDSWKTALDAYRYPVCLSQYERAKLFPGFFEMDIVGDRASTIEFERHFRENAPNSMAVFFEVIYWKLFSQVKGTRADKDTNKRVDETKKVTSQQLWNAVQYFVQTQNSENLKKIRELLGITTNVLAIPLTLAAFASPETLPMVDKQVARWVNENLAEHNRNRKSKLTLFKMNYTSLRQNDFPNYLNWVRWCCEEAGVLTRLTREEWRARDVEMAVWSAQRNGIKLDVLP